jgi:endonuclease YncB( thermonuclease family)
VGKQLLKTGLATVYQASEGAEFGGFEEAYRKVEAKAKRKKLGMWSVDPKKYESPRDYKIRTANMDESKQEETPAPSRGGMFMEWIGFRRGTK